MDNSERHAYLIMAHNNFEQLKILIGLLDDPRNDIYLHIDKKAGNPNLNIKLNYSKLFVVDPIRVTWGGDSQIKCEMNLFEAAAHGRYMYYHLLSGVDLPIKKQDEIHKFFAENRGLNFIGFDEKQDGFRERVEYYHLFRNLVGKSNKLWAMLLKAINKLSLFLQKSLQIKRKHSIPFAKGPNWVSITDEMVQYLVGEKCLIENTFKYTFCADEVFVQSLAMQSPYIKTVVNDDCREIDWIRGNPYTFRKDDIPNLLSSSALFARKFDKTIDAEVIDILVNHVKSKSFEENSIDG